MDVIDADAICAALKTARRTLASEHRAELLTTYKALATDAAYEVTEAQV